MLRAFTFCACFTSTLGLLGLVRAFCPLPCSRETCYLGCMKEFFARYKASFVLLLIFLGVATTLTLALGNPFYLFNFGYIGLALAVGIALYTNKVKHARIFVEFAVGLYMLIGIGIIERENMQIEGFWYFLFLGIFSGATIHYAVAKIFGPFIFGRGWCGYACWTAMILDVLPYKRPTSARKPYGWIRLVILVGSFVLVAALMATHVPDLGQLMIVFFLVGNALYYAIGIALAFALKDNRAFCKYVCPVAMVMKPGARFSLMRITCDQEKCISCGKCRKVCPMNVDMLDPKRSRANGTECILCLQCVDACPPGALDLTAGPPTL